MRSASVAGSQSRGVLRAKVTNVAREVGIRVMYKGEDLGTRYESEFAPRNFCSNCGSSLYDDLGELDEFEVTHGGHYPGFITGKPVGTGSSAMIASRGCSSRNML